MAIRSLFVTSEMAGFIKAGGLGDVAASLQRALHHRGMDIRILIPAYPAVLAAASSMELVGDLPGLATCGQLSGTVFGIDDSSGSHTGLSPAHSLRHVQPPRESNRRGHCSHEPMPCPVTGPTVRNGIAARTQEGLDIVAEAANDIVRGGGQIAILGLGEPTTEHMLNKLARRHRDHVCVMVGFNEAMARRIVGGSDFCLMPSRFEPCRLTQMHAQRYGSLPIAYATGGLADTIEDGGTGFLFSQFSARSLLAACARAFDIFSNKARLSELRHAAMSRAKAAVAYEQTV